MVILGIDPGLRNTGFGVIRELGKNKLSYIASGIIQTKQKDNLALRLKTLYDGLTQVINQYKPNLVSIEKIFANLNPSSTLLLGHARGALITACINQDLEVHEYTALQIKQAIVGYGHATKIQMQKMVTRLLNLIGEPKTDAADALAAAITHSNHSNNLLVLNRIKKGRIIS